MFTILYIQGFVSTIWTADGTGGMEEETQCCCYYYVFRWQAVWSTNNAQDIKPSSSYIGSSSLPCGGWGTGMYHQVTHVSGSVPVQKDLQIFYLEGRDRGRVWENGSDIRDSSRGDSFIGETESYSSFIVIDFAGSQTTTTTTATTDHIQGNQNILLINLAPQIYCKLCLCCLSEEYSKQVKVYVLPLCVFWILMYLFNSLWKWR